MPGPLPKTASTREFQKQRTIEVEETKKRLKKGIEFTEEEWNKLPQWKQNFLIRMQPLTNDRVPSKGGRKKSKKYKMKGCKSKTLRKSYKYSKRRRSRKHRSKRRR